MTWRIQYTRTFLKELSRLPKPVRERVEQIAFGVDILSDPFLDGKVQKLSGFQTYYKLRIGQYRIGLKIELEKQTIEFQRVLHRREIYRKFP